MSLLNVVHNVSNSHLLTCEKDLKSFIIVDRELEEGQEHISEVIKSGMNIGRFLNIPLCSSPSDDA